MFVHIVEGDNVRMVELAGCPRLGQETLDLCVAVGILAGKNLDGDFTIEQRVVCMVNPARSADAQRRQNLILPDCRARLAAILA